MMIQVPGLAEEVVASSTLHLEHFKSLTPLSRNKVICFSLGRSISTLRSWVSLPFFCLMEQGWVLFEGFEVFSLSCSFIKPKEAKTSPGS